MIRGWLNAAVTLVGCSLVVASCTGCGEPPLATLLEHQARVERDLGDHVGDWKAVEGKEAFRDGDGLRTHEQAEAMLELAGGGKVRVESDTTIRFRRNAPDAATATSVDVESGLAEVEAGNSAVGIKTRFGIAILSSGGKLRVDRIDGAERYRVEIGDAVFPSEDGTNQNLKVGDQLDIGIGLAELEPVEAIAAPAEQTVVAAPDAGTDASATDEATVEAVVEAAASNEPSGPPKDSLATVANADLELPLGGTVTINDPSPPTAVAFVLTSVCPEGGALEVERRRAHGKALNVALKPGSHSYRVFCFDSEGKVSRTVGARGNVRVRRATGAAQLPTTAPRNRIDTDGRRYTVMFQNLLPEIDVRWPNAPSASSYTLERTYNGNTTTERSDKPSVRFTGGQILEGEHRLRFKAAGATQSSNETTLQVRFDNAAPSVSLRTPAASGFEAGAEVRVSGVAIADTRVSILGQSVELDRQHRFDTKIAASRVFAVRIEHPRAGVQYYVRRERGSR